MSLQVLVAHTGDRLSTEPGAFKSIEALKAWLAEAASVPPPNQILLFASGKQVKFQNLAGENEIFLYNRQLISQSSTNNHTKPTLDIIPKPNARSLDDAPDTLSNPNDLEAWQDLFKARRDWALRIKDECTVLAGNVNRHADATTTIERSLAVALGNLQSHVRGLEQRYTAAQSWSEQAIQEQESLLTSLNNSRGQLSSLPASTEFLRFLPKLKIGTAKDLPSKDSSITLENFVSEDDVDIAISTIVASRQTIRNHVGALGISVQKVASNTSELEKTVDANAAHSSADIGGPVAQLMEEIEVVTTKVLSDYDHVLSLPAMPKSISQVSKMALLHTRNYLPSLKECLHELLSSEGAAVDVRNQTASRALKAMQRVAAIEAEFAQVNSQIISLDVPSDGADAFDLIALLSQLPFVYGALLVEAVRRHEWSDKIKSESAILAEDIADYREEEERRRKKWLKNIGHLIKEDLASGSALDFELNLQAEEHEWPNASRNDISEYLQALRKLQGVQEIIEELSEAAKDLDRPTRRQIKKAKNFKMGSVHEAMTGKGSFLLRENDEAKVLRSLNVKLEDELKGQRSRVRKLEDLLYKQGQVGRTSSGSLFQNPNDPSTDLSTSPEPKMPSPRMQNALVRQASANSRRTSLNNPAEEKNLARRIVQLEAELLEERKKRSDVEKETAASKDAQIEIQRAFEETRSTKKDLMENMDAQQREFAAERRILEEDLSRHKSRAEEAEDELDRILGSRDNEKLAADDRVRSAEQDLEQTKNALSNLEDATKRRDEAFEEHVKTLKTMHNSLAPMECIPGSIDELINSLEDWIGRSMRHAQELSQTLSAATSEKGALENFLKKQEHDSLSLKQQIAALEDESSSLRNDVAAKEAKHSSLATELADGRDQLRILRKKFADGETGSEALRQRVEEQSTRASSLATQLAEAKSHVNSLDVELSSLQRKYQKLKNVSEEASSRLDQRSSRDRDLTSRLVARNEELARLLETLGLSIIQRDGAMVVQRTSKLVNASTTLTDPGASMVATTAQGGISGVPVAGQTLDLSIEPALLQWMQADSGAEEKDKYLRLTSRIDEFNVNTFSESIIKLRRDIEWTGKKWKTEARNWRDKYRRAQSEAHEKIALRSFKEGDLALFLPTKNTANSATRSWAAFNIGAPHYFLRELDSHKLRNREWLVARITKLQERVVDLSKTMDSLKGADGRSIGETSDGGVSYDDDNPFELSDGLRWYLLDAVEEKTTAPSTPGLGKSTVASANVDAKGSIRMKKSSSGNDASTKLNKSLESRRSSSNSKRGSISGPPATSPELSSTPAGTDSVGADLPRNTSATHLRPGSRSSYAGPGSSGLGIEIGGSKNQDVTNTDETSHIPSLLKADSVSPQRAGYLRGFFGSASPPKSWLSPRNLSSKSGLVATGDSSTAAGNPGSGPLLASPLSKSMVIPTSATDATNQSRKSSPTRRSADTRAKSEKSGNGSTNPIASGNSGQQAWDSLFSMDVTLESPSKTAKK